MWISRKYPYSPLPQKESLGIPRGNLRVKIFDRKYKPKLEFPKGLGKGGVDQTKNPPKDMDISWNNRWFLYFEHKYM